MDTQEHMSPTRDEIKLLIDNSLLQNNERVVDKLTQAMDAKMNPAFNEMMKLAQKVGGLETKVSNLWGKFIGIGSAIAVITALVTLLITR